MHTTEQEELIKLRRLVEQQEKMMKIKDTEIEKQWIQIENLTQVILHARKKMYGPSSEVTPFPGQMSLFPEQEQLLRELAGQQKDITVPVHTRKVRKAGVREDMLSSLETEEERCIVGQDETCPVCGADLVSEKMYQMRDRRQYKAYTDLCRRPYAKACASPFDRGSVTGRRDPVPEI